MQPGTLPKSIYRKAKLVNISFEMIKKDIIAAILNILDNKIELAKQAIDSVKESRDNETKSSVGDKYETGRTMMQFELEKHMVQKNKAENQKNELLKIDINKPYKEVELGSLVLTDAGDFFISTGLGKITIGSRLFFCISPASPAGKLMLGKLTGETFFLQGKQIIISQIL
jgi:hypothetical protein